MTSPLDALRSLLDATLPVSLLNLTDEQAGALVAARDAADAALSAAPEQDERRELARRVVDAALKRSATLDIDDFDERDKAFAVASNELDEAVDALARFDATRTDGGK